MNPEKLQRKIRENPAGAVLLGIISVFYLAIIALRRKLYSAGVFKSFALPVRVICFGNITTGGTGKTSAVMMAALKLSQAGIRTAILTRGYRRPDKKRPVEVLCDGQTPSWTDCGDEAWMLYQSLRDLNIPVLVSPDRYRAGLIAVSQFGSQVLLMDDGFQHFRLKRDADIVLLDARNPFGGDYILPLGRLRESVHGIRRASMVMITHCDQVPADALALLRARITELHPKARILESIHHPEFFLDLNRARKVKLDELKGPAVALSAIGEPESFEHTLRSLGLKLRQIWRYPDHHP
ncbi:MAG: tetraacyldisaccharide 4'-kinase, partial [bacterium]